MKSEELKPQSSITAPFIFLGKMGSSIIGKFKTALNSLKNPDSGSTLGVEKLVQEAKKNSKSNYSKLRLVKRGKFQTTWLQMILSLIKLVLLSDNQYTLKKKNKLLKQ